MSLKVHNLRKSFGSTTVLNGIDLDVQQGELLVLLGASGCGKSTLLHCIAGLETIAAGKILIKENEIHNLPPADRNVAMVFQNYALYPTMTAARNITFALECEGVSKSDQRKALSRIAGLLKIQDLLDRKPRQLSGGQRQRVAIGRALVREPDIFLMDEPMSNLDAQLRLEMRGELRALHETLGATMIFVTHDQTEAMSLATRIAVMDKGQIHQIGTPYDLYYYPSSRFVAEFIGTPPINLVSGTLRHIDDLTIFQNDHLRLDLTSYRFSKPPQDGSKVIMGIRPESVIPTTPATLPGGETNLEMTIKDVEMTGGDVFVHLTKGDMRVTTRMPSSTNIRAGNQLDISFSLEAVSLFDPIRGIRL